MNRDSESRLVGFCLEQHGRFDPGAWERFSAVSPVGLATAVRTLAGVERYGNRAALAAVAAELSPLAFAELVAMTGFDASRFGGLLRAHMQRAERLAGA